MSTHTHTPGPWTSEKPSFFDPNCTRHVVDQRGYLVARINFANPIQSENEAIANAVMIASSPDLLAAVERLKAERDCAVQMLADWVAAVRDGGAGWDYWDEHYKDAWFRPCLIRDLIDAKLPPEPADE